MRLWRFSSVRSELAPSNDSQQLEERPEGVLDGDGAVVDAEVAGQVEASSSSPRSIARRHGHRVHVLGPERVGGDAGHERGVDAARQAEDHVGEPVLRHVVAQPEDEGGVHLGDRLERRRHDRLDVGAVVDGVLGDDDVDERLRGSASARVEEALAEDRSHVDVDDEHLLGELRCRAISSPSASTTIEAPSNTSSSWPPTWFMHEARRTHRRRASPACAHVGPAGRRSRATLMFTTSSAPPAGLLRDGPVRTPRPRRRSRRHGRRLPRTAPAGRCPA